MHVNIFKMIQRIIKSIVVVIIAYLVYDFYFKHIFTQTIHILLYILAWIMLSYIVIPTLTKRLTTLYVPNYFIGRTRTSTGILGDPVNLAFNGSMEDIKAAFIASGWSVADDLTLKSSFKIVSHVLLAKQYQTAPVSSLYLFGVKQSIAFELEIGNSPQKRHHVRLWKVPENFFLAGGIQVEWFGAATKDSHIGLSLFTGQVTHKIDRDVDREQEMVVDMITATNSATKEEYRNFTSSYHSRNGGGDVFYTSGSLMVLTIKKSM